MKKVEYEFKPAKMGYQLHIDDTPVAFWVSEALSKEQVHALLENVEVVKKIVITYDHYPIIGAWKIKKLNNEESKSD